MSAGSVLLRKAAITSGVRRFRTAAVCRIKRPRPTRVSLLCTVLPMSCTLACSSDAALGGSGVAVSFFVSGAGAAPSAPELVGASGMASSFAMMMAIAVSEGPYRMLSIQDEMTGHYRTEGLCLGPHEPSHKRKIM